MAKRMCLGAVLIVIALVGSLGHLGSAQAEQEPLSDAAEVEQCESLPFCTPSFFAWELSRANYENREADSRNIAQHLISIQKKNGRWGLGSPWGRTAVDFKKRTRNDAESWEVAEVGLMLMQHHQKFGDAAAKKSARSAAQYLRDRVVQLGSDKYLAHMPDCNNYLQPHSTLSSAALLNEFKRYRTVAAQLKRSGKEMKWRRIIPKAGRTDLRTWRWGPKINDYERIQSGWYLEQMGDRSGPRILSRFGPDREMDFERAQPYAVMVDINRGALDQARSRAENAVWVPAKGFDVALASWLQTALGDSESD